MFKKIGNRIIIAAMIGMLTVTGMGLSTKTVRAANTTNEDWSFILSVKNTERSYTTWRKKTNATKIYINWSSTYGGDLTKIQVGAYGTNTNSSSTRYKDGKSSGDHDRQCIMSGSGKYSLTNCVNELGYNYASVGMLGNKGSGYAKGEWSPDSAGSYTVLQ